MRLSGSFYGGTIEKKLPDNLHTNISMRLSGSFYGGTMANQITRQSPILILP